MSRISSIAFFNYQLRILSFFWWLRMGRVWQIFKWSLVVQLLRYAFRGKGGGFRVLQQIKYLVNPKKTLFRIFLGEFLLSRPTERIFKVLKTFLIENELAKTCKSKELGNKMFILWRVKTNWIFLWRGTTTLTEEIKLIVVAPSF